MAVALVHPGGVRTVIASSARRTELSNAETAAQTLWTRFLRLDPAAAAERIVRGVERREKSACWSAATPSAWR